MTEPSLTASIAVVHKLGMEYEGRMRDHVFTNGAWRDSVLYAVLEHEWTTRHDRQAAPPS